MTIQTRDELARQLADAHYTVEPTIQHIYRLVAPAELAPDEPIKLLEVNASSVPLGIRPVFFGPDADIPISSVVVDVAPEELQQIRSGLLALPNGWVIGEEYPRPQASVVM